MSLKVTNARRKQRVRNSLRRSGKIDIEVFCAGQSEISPKFSIGQTIRGAFQPTFESAFFPAA